MMPNQNMNEQYVEEIKASSTDVQRLSHCTSVASQQKGNSVEVLGIHIENLDMIREIEREDRLSLRAPPCTIASTTDARGCFC
jgi:hypothetical protein